MVSILQGAVKFFPANAHGLAKKMPSAHSLQLLYNAVQRLSGTRGIDTGLAQVLELLCSQSQWKAAIAWITRPDEKPQFQCAWHASSQGIQALEACFKTGAFSQEDTIPFLVMQQKSLVFAPVIARGGRNEANNVVRELGLHCALGIPLPGRDHVLGVIELLGSDASEPEEGMIALLQTLGNDIGLFLEARRLESQLHEKNEKLLQMQRIARLASWEIDLSNLKLYGCRDAARVMGLPIDALPSNIHELLAYIPEEDHDIFNSLLAGAQQRPYPFVTVEHRFCAPGGMRYLMVKAEGQFDQNGRPVRISGTMQDITEQKLANIQATLSEQRWEAAFRNSPVPSIITELDSGLCLDANDEMCRLLGLSLNEVVGKTTTELMIWPANEPRSGFIEELKRRGSVRQQEFRARVDGVDHYLLVNMERIEFNDYDALYGQWVDITPVKKLEEKLRLTAAAVEHAADALVLIDRKGNIVAVNPAFSAITGYAAEQTLGQWFLGLLHKPTGRHDKHFFKKAIETLENHNQWKGQVWTQRANGEVFPAVLTLGAIRSPETNKITHYVGVFSDISPQKEYEERLRKLALHDELTGLANRTLLIERGNRALLQAERHDGRLAVLFIDLNRFKSVNDAYGHAVGDALLQQVADRLILCVRASDTVARVGGDEFVILLTDLAQDDDAYQVADKVHLAMVQPFLVEGVEIEVGGSVGVARYPQDGVDMTMLLRFADEGLYQAKRAGESLD